MLTGNGTDCVAANGSTAQCSPGEAGEGLCAAASPPSPPAPAPVDCVGSWSDCDESCTKTYSVSVPAEGTGAECPEVAGSAAECAAGEGACPPNVDCVGSYSTCDSFCEKVYTVSVLQSGNGTDCVAANGSTAQCSPGEGACPAGSCVGSWSSCLADCSNKTYSVTTAATGGGVPCPAEDGATDFCAPGEGACPADIDCVGAWSECDENCTREYTVLEEQSGNGAECENATGVIGECEAGQGLCAAASPLSPPAPAPCLLYTSPSPRDS